MPNKKELLDEILSTSKTEIATIGVDCLIQVQEDCDKIIQDKLPQFIDTTQQEFLDWVDTEKANISWNTTFCFCICKKNFVFLSAIISPMGSWAEGLTKILQIFCSAKFC